MISQSMGHLQLLFIGSTATNISFCGSILRSLVSHTSTSPPPYPHIDKKKGSVKNGTTLI